MLRGLGFSDYESRIYLHLLKESPCTGYQLSQVTGIHRANTYQALESLLKKEAVVADGSKPKMYNAVDPKDLISNIQTGLAASFRVLRDELSKLKGGGLDTNLFTLHGHGEMIEKLRAALKESRGETVALLGVPEIRLLIAELSAARRRAGGLVCKTYHEADEDFGIGVIRVAAESWLFHGAGTARRWVGLAAAGQQTVFGFADDSEPDASVSYWTRNPDIVFSQFQLISRA
jgi:HTH-type transcriptional regulator, sugar sensing transcriptional regulator